MSISTPVEVRADLIRVAYARVRADGVNSLQARRITKEAGVSTTAVYTHFDGMAGLLLAVAAQAFADFSAAIDAPELTADPLADLLASGIAYRNFAACEPFAYELLFNRYVSARGPGMRTEFTTAFLPLDDPVGATAWSHIRRRVEAVIEAGIITEPNADVATTQLWCGLHGFVCLDIAGHLGPDYQVPVFQGLAFSLLVGLGADRSDVASAIGRAVERVPLAEWTAGGSDA